MTPHEYTDAARFPLTTRPGISAHTQSVADACELDELHVQWARWHKLTRPQRARLAELEQKAGLPEGRAGAAAFLAIVDSVVAALAGRLLQPVGAASPSPASPCTPSCEIRPGRVGGLGPPEDALAH